MHCYSRPWRQHHQLFSCIFHFTRSAFIASKWQQSVWQMNILCSSITRPHLRLPMYLSASQFVFRRHCRAEPAVATMISTRSLTYFIILFSKIFWIISLAFPGLRLCWSCYFVTPTHTHIHNRKYMYIYILVDTKVLVHLCAHSHCA